MYKRQASVSDSNSDFFEIKLSPDEGLNSSCYDTERSPVRTLLAFSNMAHEIRALPEERGDKIRELISELTIKICIKEASEFKIIKLLVRAGVKGIHSGGGREEELGQAERVGKGRKGEGKPVDEQCRSGKERSMVEIDLRVEITGQKLSLIHI